MRNKLIYKKGLINIMDQTEHKIYYKGNPYTRRDYIPSSALKNRSTKNYLVEFPQGAQYFPSSRKKQYSYIHNQSEIKEQNLFYQEPTQYNHGTLEVSDIEGAVPSSLMSQAVKNRIKGNYWQNSRVRVSSVQSSDQILNNLNRRAQTIQQNELGAKRRLLIQTQNIGSNNNVNYHHRKNRVQTEPVQSYQSYNLRHIHSNNLPNDNFQFKYNPEIKHNSQSEPYNKNIDALERELFKKQEKRLKPTIQLAENHKTIIPMSKNYTEITPKIGNKNEFEPKKQKQENIYNPRHRSVKEIKDMWHGDIHKIRLFPHKEIRKFNPTYLSTEANYIPQYI